MRNKCKSFSKNREERQRQALLLTFQWLTKSYFSAKVTNSKCSRCIFKNNTNNNKKKKKEMQKGREEREIEIKKEK